jgi:prevent-host-death family protein
MDQAIQNLFGLKLRVYAGEHFQGLTISATQQVRLFRQEGNMAIIAITTGALRMRSVNVATLKNQLSKYLTFAKAGEEVIIRDRNLPVAKLVPFSAEDADEQELRLAAEGKLRLPSARFNLREFLKIRGGKVAGHKAIEALLADREEE